MIAKLGWKLVFVLPLAVALLATQNCEPPHIHLGGEVACQYRRPNHCRWLVADGGCDLVCLERPAGSNITAPTVPVRRPMGFKPNGPLDAGDWIDWGPGGSPP